MIELVQEKDDTPEMVELFSIDGKVYSVPKRPRVNVALKYLTDMRKFGPMIAEMSLLESLLGEEGYTALTEFEGLSQKQLGAIQDAAARLALGVLEDTPEGNDGSGSVKSAG